MENIFELQLNEQGKSYLVRLHLWAKILYACSALTCIFDAINAWFAFKNYSRFADSYSDLLRFSFYFNTLFLPVYGILVALQGYYLYRFSIGSRKAIEFGDNHTFNTNFKWLLRHTLIAAMLFTLNSIWAMLVSYTELRLQNMGGH